ncbi:M20 aminoacylase family protein [Tropicimonas sp. IMCC6043]|uniref:M20 aminoacylase family protein n=1 Tax=Tropicimonas sp. IMCC6043 TaxID=2510645 RepID=UPI00101DBE48|nr:M20 aminoacylase family protein [Tropicimonas sp. IMCC6043]RYH09282.1 amidohydrolase [Tropicimonas sp. IMCC6043]
MPVLNRVAEFAEDMQTWRRWMHRNPELGFELPKTAAFVAERLREIGVDELHEGIAGTGMVALVRGQRDGPAIGLRADMDALPIREETGAAHASETDGRMHACGHDGHTAMLLGAAKYLVETRRFAGTAVLIFQPAEELGGGGQVMCREGIMERFGIEQVYALHCSPDHEAGVFATRAGPIMAAVDDFEIRIRGVGGHAAWPDRCADPVAAAVQLASALDTVLARNVNAFDNVVLSVTRIEAGSTSNVIPAEGLLAGTVRSFSKQAQALVKRRIGEICDGIAAAMAVEIVLDYHEEYPVTVNHPAETAFAVEVAREVAGATNVTSEHPPEMGAEDFSFMLEARPGAYLFLGQGLGPRCHHPAFDFNDAVAPLGASFFARLVERALPLP